MMIDGETAGSILRPIENIDISDLTASVVTGPPDLVRDEYGMTLGMSIPFDVEPTAEEQRRIIARMTTASSNEESVRESAFAALDDNRAWVTTTHPQIITGADSIIDSPTATAREKQLAQAVKALGNQVADLCKQNNGLIRFALRKFDGTD